MNELARDTSSRILVPFHLREALSTHIACKRAGVTANTLRGWCERFGLGRKIGGTWWVSSVALSMHLDGDRKALAAYLAGERHAPIVASYYERAGLADILQTQEFSLRTTKPQTQQIAQS